MDKILKALNKARDEHNDKNSEAENSNHHVQDSTEHADNVHAVPQQNRVVINESEGKAESEQNVARPAGDHPDLDPKLIVYHEPESLAAEHFKLLRSRIVNPPDDRELRTILVTSAMDNAGKTLVASNLSLSIAQGVDPYALLIDTDVRKPAVHKMFGIESQPGLSEYLTDQATLPECLVKSAVTKLTILPAGSQVPNPAEIITSSRMKELIKEAKSRYHDRFIVLDSPPVNLASETVDLAKLVDAVLLVIRCGMSSKPVVEQAINKIGREKILGVVFNAYERPSGKYGYYSKKTAYYG